MITQAYIVFNDDYPEDIYPIAIYSSCGLMITTQRSNPMPLAIPQNIQDKEG